MKKIILFFIIIILLSSLAVAQQMQVVPIEKISVKRFDRKIAPTQRLIVEDKNEQLYTSKGCKIIHRLEDALSIECPTKVVSQIPNAIKTEKLKVQAVEIPEDFIPSDMSNNEYLHVPQVWSQGYTGKNRVIAILDTGIDYNHPALKNDIVANKSFVSYTDDPMDDDGHGTHMAGIITSDGNPAMGDIEENESKGVAPDAKIMMAKVCWPRPVGCDGGDIVAGLEWAVAGYNKTMDCFEKCGHTISCCRGYDGCSLVRTNVSSPRYNCTGNYTVNVKPDAISISLGSDSTWISSTCGKGKPLTWESYLAKKVNWVTSKGIAVVVAAGNSVYGVSSPACASEAIAAGGVDWFIFNRNYFDVVWQGSGKGYAMKDHGVLAPWIAYSTLPNNQYGYLAGTSISAPHVAGLIALIKEKKPTMIEEHVKTKIYGSAVKLNPDQEICFDEGCIPLAVFWAENHEYEEGYGRIDAARALGIAS